MKVTLHLRWIRLIAAAIAIVILGSVWAWRTAQTNAPSPSEPSPQTIVDLVDRGLSVEESASLRDQITTLEAQIAENETNGKRDISQVLQLGNLYYQLGDLKTATSWYQNILSTNPSDAPSLENMGQTMLEAGDYAGAERAWKAAINIEAYEPIYIGLADLIDQHFPERTAETQGILETAIANLGQTPGLLIRLAQWYEAQGKLDEAISHYEVAHRLSPKSASIADELDRLKRERSDRNR